MALSSDQIKQAEASADRQYGRYELDGYTPADIREEAVASIRYFQEQLAQAEALLALADQD
jgi:hypothetical protein